MRLLDTDVIVDIRRGYVPAVQWYTSLPEKPCTSGFVVMELISGCMNKVEVIRLQTFMAGLPVIWPTEVDCQRGLADLTRFYLSHNLGLIDALIAATAVGRGAALCTFNTKHFSAVPGLVMEQPYQRS